MKKTYKIDVDCANCAARMEAAANKTQGVKSAAVNFMTLKMKVEFEDGADIDAVMKNVLKNCKNTAGSGRIFISIRLNFHDYHKFQLFPCKKIKVVIE